MDSKPVISVVMSVYNDADKLSLTIDSVLSQTFDDFEFIIVNDGSRDPETHSILSGYAAEDSRIKLLVKENQGLTMALIDGCNLARGKYIARIDVGDLMLPNRLQLQKKVLDQYPDVGFVSCWTEFCAPEWEHLWVAKGAPENAGPVDLLPENPGQGLKGDIPHHGSVMFRKSIYDDVGGYRWQFYYGQDWDLWYRLAATSGYYIVTEMLYRVRILADSISMTNSGRQKKIAQCSLEAFIARRRGLSEKPFLEKAAAIRPNPGITQNRKKNLEPGYYFIGEALRRRGNRQAKRYFIRAILENPMSLRSLIRLCQSFI